MIEKHERMLNEALLRMVDHEAGCPARMQHFLKVAGFARAICLAEGVDEDTSFTTVAAALVHDIGIRPALEKLGRSSGKLQEELGPEPARRLLTEVGLEPARAERIAYLVGHHHTYDHIDGIDYQVLVEADFLVNLYENGSGPEAIASAGENIFRTATGKRLLATMFAE